MAGFLSDGFRWLTDSKYREVSRQVKAGVDDALKSKTVTFYGGRRGKLESDLRDKLMKSTDPKNDAIKAAKPIFENMIFKTYSTSPNDRSRLYVYANDFDHALAAVVGCKTTRTVQVNNEEITETIPLDELFKKFMVNVSTTHKEMERKPTEKTAPQPEAPVTKSTNLANLLTRGAQFIRTKLGFSPSSAKAASENQKQDGQQI